MYMESGWGPGPTPFRPDQLVEFAKAGTLVQQLNTFNPSTSWRGPTKRALVDALADAVGMAPDVFLEAMPAFADAGRPYQYGLISGFKRLWDEPKEKTPAVAWDKTWVALMVLFERIIGDDNLWMDPASEDRDLTPTSAWIAPLISEFLRAGTRDDEKSYDEHLLPQGWRLICVLVEKSEATDAIHEDAMTKAINTAKGKAIEALFSHALRACRIGDRIRNKSHAEEWAVMKPVFDVELTKCHGANFEFSTLVGAYLANIEYISAEWMHANVDRIFPVNAPHNLFCAVAGLAYAPATRSIYRLLAGRSVFDRALRMDLGKRNVRERLVQRIALAYLWGDEQLTSSRFSYLFDEKRLDDLQVVSNFFWSVNGQDLNADQVQRILVFWRKCADWVQKRNMGPAELLADLSRLSVYLIKMDHDEAALLEGVAPYVHIGHNTDQFIQQLLRLAPLNPSAVSSAFDKLLQTYEPTFDYQDRLKSLIRVLSERGHTDKGIVFADRLRRIPGMRELYVELVRPPSESAPSRAGD